MVSGWLPWSAASLVSGVVLLLLALSTLPLTGHPPEVLAAASADVGAWHLSAFVLVLASACLTLGLPTLLALMTARSRRLSLVGACVWALGTIGLTGLGMMLSAFQVVAVQMEPTLAQAEALLASTPMRWMVWAVLGCFMLGQLISAVALLTARRVAVWAPALLVLHLLTLPLTVGIDPTARAAHSLLLGAALLAVALRASEEWASLQTS